MKDISTTLREKDIQIPTHLGLMSLLDFYAVDETLIQEFTGNDIMVWIGDKAKQRKRPSVA